MTFVLKNNCVPGHLDITASPSSKSIFEGDLGAALGEGAGAGAGASSTAAAPPREVREARDVRDARDERDAIFTVSPEKYKIKKG